MKLTYTHDYQIKIWKNDLIVDLLIFKTIEEVREWKKENPDIHLKYDSNDKITGNTLLFRSTNEAERITGIGRGNISLCCNKKRKLAGGYYWVYNNKNGI